MQQRLNSIESKHEAMIHDSQYDYYGKRLATCASDGMISIYDVSNQENPQLLHSFRAHNAPILQICWAHPKFGTILASCGFDRKVCVWKEVKPNDWQEVISHTEHISSVSAVSFAPAEYGLCLAACSSDGFISVLSRTQEDRWDKVIKIEAHPSGVNGVHWAPATALDELKDVSGNKGKYLPRFVSGGSDRTIKIWAYNSHSNTYENVAEWSAHQDWVRDVAWCPVFTGSYELIASCSEDGEVAIWALDREEFIETGRYSSPVRKYEQKVEGPAWKISWSIGGNLIAVSYSKARAESSILVLKENENGDWGQLAKFEERDPQ
eukprot:TRINITY_DN8122_c0_g1_i3.p1 TRINITY_DN8122_c0_g1~~TRINITY_DN8122_c0_g1_i3.p1  ORF type:complete len:322 (+),score=63.35 TRINITY_DN8122_c0_g1_i3:119-1084(+)